MKYDVTNGKIFSYTANSANTYLTEYTKAKVGTKLSSDHSLCGYAQAINY